MRTRWSVWLCLLGVAVLALAACGGGGEKKSETGGGEKVACEGSPLSTEPALPEGFPKPPELTYTKSEKQGPTLVVEGYFEGELKSAYNDYKSGFESAGYDVLFDEIEDKDSEVSYRDPDKKTTGIVALRAECEEADRISVHITNRPA